MNLDLKILASLSLFFALSLPGAEPVKKAEKEVLKPAPALSAPGTSSLSEEFFTGSAQLISRVDKFIITVGEIITYEMEVSVPEGYDIALPPPGAQLGEFFIRDYQFPSPEKKAGKVEQKFIFKITAYTTGELVIPPVPVMIMKQDKTVARLLAQEIRIQIAPVTSPEELEIKDIKPPSSLPFNYLPWLIGAGAGVGILILAGAGLFLANRYQRAPAPALEPLPPPDQLALSELAELEASGLLEKGELDVYYTKLSQILRRYLGLRYQIYALEYTTSEILEALKTRGLTHQAYSLIRDFLTETDLVKFARYFPEPDARREIINQAKKIIELTREKENQIGEQA